MRRRRIALPLSLECLEPRHLLAGIVDLPELKVVDESWDTPAVVLESKCIVIEVADSSPESSEELDSAGDSDAADERDCGSGNLVSEHFDVAAKIQK